MVTLTLSLSWFLSALPGIALLAMLTTLAVMRGDFDEAPSFANLLVFILMTLWYTLAVSAIILLGSGVFWLAVSLIGGAL